MSLCKSLVFFKILRGKVSIQSRILRKSLLRNIIISYYIKMKNISEKETAEKLLNAFLSVNTIYFLATEYLPGLGRDRDHSAVVEGQFTIGPETERRGGCYSLHVADSGQRTYQGPRYYAHLGDLS